MSDFTLPLDFPITDSKGGKLTLSSPAENIYLVTINSPKDNRITPNLLTNYIKILDLVEEHAPNTAVLVSTSGVPKFFSNGFNIELVMGTENFLKDYFHKFVLRMLTFSLPTVAVVEGHCFAAAFIIAMAHDYRIFHPTSGKSCMNELDIGIELGPGIASLMREKLGPATSRKVLLQAHRFNGEEAFRYGIADKLGSKEPGAKLYDTALEFIEENRLIGKGSTGVYGKIRDETYRETIRLLEKYDAMDYRDAVVASGKQHWSKL